MSHFEDEPLVWERELREALAPPPEMVRRVARESLRRTSSGRPLLLWPAAALLLSVVVGASFLGGGRSAGQTSPGPAWRLAEEDGVVVLTTPGGEVVEIFN